MSLIQNSWEKYVVFKELDQLESMFHVQFDELEWEMMFYYHEDIEELIENTIKDI